MRSSGWRFNLPVDWIGLFYYGLGLVQTITWGAMFFSNRVLPGSQQPETEISHRSSGAFPWKQTILFCALFFLISAAIPITETAIPPRYPVGWLDQAMAKPKLEVELNQVGITASLPDFAAQNGMTLLYGRALYPRYYGPKKGIPDDEWFAFIPQDYGRLGFYLVGPDLQNVVLPLKNVPTSIPHAADVIVLACPQSEYLEAQMVILTGEKNIIFKRAPRPNWDCSEGE